MIWFLVDFFMRFFRLGGMTWYGLKDIFFVRDLGRGRFGVNIRFFFDLGDVGVDVG